jgi:hypothetical protein
VSFPRVIEKGRRGIEEDERFHNHNGTVMETGFKKKCRIISVVNSKHLLSPK